MLIPNNWTPSKWLLLAALAQVHSFQGQPLAQFHFRAATCTVSGSHWSLPISRCLRPAGNHERASEDSWRARMAAVGQDGDDDAAWLMRMPHLRASTPTSDYVSAGQIRAKFLWQRSQRRERWPNIMASPVDDCALSHRLVRGAAWDVVQ